MACENVHEWCSCTPKHDISLYEEGWKTPQGLWWKFPLWWWNRLQTVNGTCRQTMGYSCDHFLIVEKTTIKHQVILKIIEWLLISLHLPRKSTNNKCSTRCQDQPTLNENLVPGANVCDDGLAIEDFQFPNLAPLSVSLKVLAAKLQ